MPVTYTYSKSETLSHALANGATNYANTIYQTLFRQAWTQGISDKISYSPSTDTYTYYSDNAAFSGSGATAYSFPASSALLPPAGSPFANGNFSTFATKDASTNDVTTLLLFKLGADNTQIQLSYTTFGLISFLPVNGRNERETRYFVLGNPYGFFGSAPVSGKATYSRISSGVYHDSSGNYVTSGTSSLSADFGNGNESATVNFNMTFTGVNMIAGGPSLAATSFSSIRGVFGIAEASYSGELTGPTSGNYYGDFYGPGAEEFGLVYVLGGGNPSTSPINGIGVAVGKKN